jgi:hypothetical protein
MNSNVHHMTSSLAEVIEGPSVVDALRQVGMLVRVTCTAPGTMKTDRRASEEADEAKKAKQGTASVKVRILSGADEDDKKVRKLQREAIHSLDRRTTPWGMDSQRLLPNANFMEFIKDFTKTKEDIETIVARIEANAQSICDRANEALGDFDVERLQPQDLIGVYSISIEFQEIPAAEFPGMPKAAQEWLSKQYAQRAEVRYQDGLKSGLGRLLKPMSELVERIDAYDKAKAVGKDERNRGEGSFRDTLTENVREAVECLASFNLLNDPELKDFTNSLILFQNVTAKDLRKDAVLRTGVKTKAQETIERLKNLMG